MTKRQLKQVAESINRSADLFIRFSREAGTKKFATDLAKRLRKFGEKDVKIKCVDDWYYVDFNSNKTKER
jgi:hypothetical protein